MSFSKYSHQPSFVPLYQAHPRIDIIAVADDADIEEELAAANREWATRLGVPYLEGVDRGFEDDRVHIVSIGHEIEKRADLAQRAAAAGKALWIDKFIGATVAECNAVVAAVDGAGVCSIIPSFTYGELARQSQSILESNSLGTLLGVHADGLFSKGWPRPVDSSAAPTFLPPGRWKFPDIKRELLCVGAYGVGLVQTCLGPIRHVYGRAGAHFFPEHASHGGDDFGTLTLTDDSGRIATVCGGRIGVASHPQGGPSRAYLIGSSGSAVVDGKGPNISSYLREEIVGADYSIPPEDPMMWHSRAPIQTTTAAPDSVGFAAALEDLLGAMDDGRDTSYTVTDARDNMEILTAGYFSVVQDQIVSLPMEPVPA